MHRLHGWLSPHLITYLHNIIFLLLRPVRGGPLLLLLPQILSPLRPRHLPARVGTGSNTEL